MVLGFAHGRILVESEAVPIFRKAHYLSNMALLPALSLVLLAACVLWAQSCAAQVNYVLYEGGQSSPEPAANQVLHPLTVEFSGPHERVLLNELGNLVLFQQVKYGNRYNSVLYRRDVKVDKELIAPIFEIAASRAFLDAVVSHGHAEESQPNLRSVTVMNGQLKVMNKVTFCCTDELPGPAHEIMQKLQSLVKSNFKPTASELVD